jgi:hypothetical protein
MILKSWGLKSLKLAMISDQLAVQWCARTDEKYSRELDAQSTPLYLELISTFFVMVRGVELVVWWVRWGIEEGFFIKYKFSLALITRQTQLKLPFYHTYVQKL